MPIASAGGADGAGGAIGGAATGAPASARGPELVVLPGFVELRAPGGGAKPDVGALPRGRAIGGALRRQIPRQDEVIRRRQRGAGQHVSELAHVAGPAPQGQGLQVYAVPQADAGGAAAAVGSVIIASQPTQSGMLAFYVGGERVQVIVSAGQSTSSIATRRSSQVMASSHAPCSAHRSRHL